MTRVPLLERLGLHRPELRAWAMYDWANSVFMTTVILVFPIYFVKVVSAGVPNAVATERIAWATGAAMTVAALMSPVLGAVADFAAAKKKLMAVSIAVGVAATAALATVGTGEWKWGLALFILGNIAVNASFVFYESFLPHIASQDEIDRVSTAGYAIGYVGGGIPLALNLLWIQDPGAWGFADAGSATRCSFLMAGVWWAVFAIPLFRRVPEPPARLEADESPGSALRAAFARLGETMRELRGYRQAFLLLLAFVFYNDGIQTIIRMATPFGTSIGLSQGTLLGALVMVQFVAVPFAFLFGFVARWMSVKRALYIPIAVYVVVTAIAYRMQTAREFFLLCFLVAMVQGGSQALSRSLFATMIPRHRSAEFFGFWSVFEKFAGVLGPIVFAVVLSLTGSSRPAILALLLFFVVGGALLSFVNIEEGRARAREAEARAGLREPDASRSTT